MAKIILDTSIIITWCNELQNLVICEKIQKCGYEVIVPKKVSDEILDRNMPIKKLLDRTKILPCDEDTFSKYSNRFFRLGKGEVAVITLGTELKEKDSKFYCVLDDDYARNACEKLDLDYIGNIGLVGILIDNEKVGFQRGIKLLETMKEEGTRLPENYEILLEECTSINSNKRK